MKHYGIIGFPLAHSFSPSYFNKKFVAENIVCAYNAFPLDSIAQLPDLINSNPDLCGLNVTIPYKTKVIPYLDFISIDAQKINAVNCIKIENGKLFGFNTDQFGFAESLKPLLVKDMSAALVLGTGGSSKAVCYALEQLNLNFKLVSASGKGAFSYDELSEEIIQNHLLIVNTSPVGMYPNMGDSPEIPYHFLNENHLLYDLIYNPEETLFLKNGKKQNAQIKNGKEMLLLQADKSWEIWNDKNICKETIPLK